VFGTFQDVGLHNLIESKVDVDGDVVDMVLHSVTAHLLGLTLHCGTVLGSYLVGECFDALAGFEVDEPIRFVAKVEVKLLVAVEGVEKEHFVFAMAQVPQSVEKGFLLVVAH